MGKKVAKTPGRSGQVTRPGGRAICFPDTDSPPTRRLSCPELSPCGIRAKPSRLEDYALLGNLYTAALISHQGSVDWLCFPRFDSGAWHRNCVQFWKRTEIPSPWQFAGEMGP